MFCLHTSIERVPVNTTNPKTVVDVRVQGVRVITAIVLAYSSCATILSYLLVYVDAVCEKIDVHFVQAVASTLEQLQSLIINSLRMDTKILIYLSDL